MPAGAITLFHIRGIRIGVDYSWFLVLFLIIFLLSGQYRDVLDADNNAIGPYILALASALLFFGSILLHELGHAWVAIRRGIGISGITLVDVRRRRRLDRDSDSPGTEFKVADRRTGRHSRHRARLRRRGGAAAGGDDFRDAAAERAQRRRLAGGGADRLARRNQRIRARSST